jgi:hypothetical protein
MEGACSAGKLAARAIVEAHAPGAPEVRVHELGEELEPPWLKLQQHGFESRVQALGSFERAERAEDLLLDAGDEALAALRALEQAPSRLARSLHVGGLALVPGVSLLGQLRNGLAELGSRALRRVRPGAYPSPRADVERVAAQAQRVASAVSSLPGGFG